MENKIALEEESKEFEAILKTWRQKSREITTPDELKDYIDHLLNDYEHDYGTAVRATSCISVASANMCNHILGLTGFQVSCVMWDFIKQYAIPHNKCGLKIIDYDNMLYPQYEEQFRKTIPSFTMDHIMEEAKKFIEEYGDTANPVVVEHWKNLANGIPPFEYVLLDDYISTKMINTHYD